MLIDTHCHLDAPEFDGDRAAVVARAVAAGVRRIVIPAVSAATFEAARRVAHATPGGCYALGIHPLYVPDAGEDDLAQLADWIAGSLDDPRFVAIGEIGLDFFVPASADAAVRERQLHFYRVQLALARQYGLPVLLHVRRSQDTLLMYLRRGARVGGIAHAFNGSFQQAAQFIAQGFALGVGGAMTFERALQIRRLATQLPLDDLVLETDAPDIAPAWLGGAGQAPARNEPAETAGVARVLALLRGEDEAQVIARTTATAHRVLPRLAFVPD